MRARTFRLLIFIFSLFTSTVFAANQAAFSGFHTGLQVGVASGDFALNASSAQTNPTTAFTVSQFQYNHIQGVSPVARLLVGYGWEFQLYYLGVNLTGSIYKVSGKDNASNNTVFLLPPQEHFPAYTLTLKDSLSLSAEPGIVLSPTTLLFGHVGAVISEGKLNSVTRGSLRPAIPNEALLVNNRRKTVFGYELGLGLQHFVTARIAFIMQYLHSHFGRVNAFAAESQTNVPDIRNHSTFDSSSNAFTTGILYYFNNRHNGLPVPGDEMNHGLEGAYFEVFGGILQSLITYSGRYETDLAGVPVITHTQNGKQSNTNLHGGVGIGVGGVFNTMYLGVEATGNFGNATSFVNYNLTDGVDSVPMTMKAKVRNYLNVDLKLGYLLNSDNLAYILVGTAVANIKLTSGYTFPSTPTLIIGGTTHDDTFGLRLGLGIESKITPKIAIGIQDVFTFYSGLTSIQTGTTTILFFVPTPLNGRAATSATARTNSITAHISYYI